MEENIMITIIGVAVCIGVFGSISTCTIQREQTKREAMEKGYVQIFKPSTQATDYWTKPEYEVNKKND
jgi:hypothetical protein